MKFSEALIKQVQYKWKDSVVANIKDKNELLKSEYENGYFICINNGSIEVIDKVTIDRRGKKESHLVFEHTYTWEELEQIKCDQKDIDYRLCDSCKCVSFRSVEQFIKIVENCDHNDRTICDKLLYEACYMTNNHIARFALDNGLYSNAYPDTLLMACMYPPLNDDIISDIIDTNTFDVNYTKNGLHSFFKCKNKKMIEKLLSRPELKTSFSDFGYALVQDCLDDDIYCKMIERIDNDITFDEKVLILNSDKFNKSTKLMKLWITKFNENNIMSAIKNGSLEFITMMIDDGDYAKHVEENAPAIYDYLIENKKNVYVEKLLKDHKNIILKHVATCVVKQLTDYIDKHALLFRELN